MPVNKIDKIIKELKPRIFEDVKHLNYLELEEFAEKYSVSKGIVHRILIKIAMENPGWGFSPSNSVPYGREQGLNRNRKKGDKYEHDKAEPDWERTHYKITKPI